MRRRSFLKRGRPRELVNFTTGECVHTMVPNGLALADVPALVIRLLKFITNVQYS
jgi:hypothetical protein